MIKANFKLLGSLLKIKLVNGLSLGPDDSYQLDLPAHTIFIEPLIKSGGNDYGGGMFIIPNNTYCYLTNNDNSGEYRGIWIRCSSSGIVYISNYRHNGSVVSGFRIWYLGN